MAVKLSLVILSAFVILQNNNVNQYNPAEIMTWTSQATVIRREAPSDEKNASQTIDEAIQSFKTGLDDLMKNIQSNELFRNVSESFRQFSKSVEQEGRELVQKIQNDGHIRPSN